METFILVSVWGREGEPDRAREIAWRLDIDAPPRDERREETIRRSPFNSVLHLDLVEEIANRYIRELERNGLTPSLLYTAKYSRDDILSASLSVIRTTHERYDVEVDTDARYEGATGGCERCRSLCEVHGPIIFKQEPQPGIHIARTQTRDWIVSRHLAELLREVPGTHEYLEPLQDAGAWEGWERLIVDSTMRPFGPHTIGYVIGNQCPACKRNGYGVSRRLELPRLRYRKEDLRDAAPINGTYELIAGTTVQDGRLIARAMPMLLVNSDVARILLDEAPEDVDLEPVEAV
ncbi:MAG: hypothetical protein HRU13_08240 [Phycisphaerales bacterium]|nr:hypothetical protein [Phycisphaerales bacterium]